MHTLIGSRISRISCISRPSSSFLLRPHEFDWFLRIGRVQERKHDIAEFFKVNRLGHVIVETCVSTFSVDVAENVGRECDDGEVELFLLFLPLPDLPTGLVSILVWHVKIALPDCQWELMSATIINLQE